MTKGWSIEQIVAETRKRTKQQVSESQVKRWKSEHVNNPMWDGRSKQHVSDLARARIGIDEKTMKFVREIRRFPYLLVLFFFFFFFYLMFVWFC